MEWVSLLQGWYVVVRRGSVRVDWSRASRTDRPTCTHPLVTQVAISINDGSDQEVRNQLARLLPRLLRAEGGEEVTRGLRVWLLRRRLARLREEPTARGRELLELLVSGGSGEDLRAAAERVRAQYGLERWNYADTAIVVCAMSDVDGFPRSGYLILEADANLIRDLVGSTPREERAELLEDLLNALDKLRAEAGTLGEDPEELYLSPEELAIVVETLGRGD